MLLAGLVLLLALHSLPHSGGSGGGQARPSRLPVEGGWEVGGGGHGDTRVALRDGGAARSGIFSGSELKLHLDQYFLL